MPKLEIQNTNIDKIRSYTNNAKEHPEKQISQIAESIRQFGFNNPILIDEHGEIIAGHGRFLAARALKLGFVPTICLSHLSEVQKKAYRLADNKIAENGGWNVELLKLELEQIELNTEGLDISSTGFDCLELDTMFSPQNSRQPDEKTNAVPYIPDNEIVSKPGDTWLVGPHRIICGNSLNVDTFQTLMHDERADMILQDPPFNVPVNGHVCGAGSVKHREFAMASGEMTSDEFTQFLTTNFKLCAKFSRDGALHYNFMDWRHQAEILNTGKHAFADLINMCVWVKSSGGMGSLYRSQHELCFIFKNGRASHINNVELGAHGRYRTNVWQYAGVNTFGRHKGEIRLHPTVKPVEMLHDAILDVTKRGDIVMDTFLGSGSTLIAAHKAQRICRGIEYEPRYIDTTIRRFHDLFGIDAIHAATGKTYTSMLAETGGHNE